VTGRTARRRVVRISLPSGGRPGTRDGRADLLAAEEPLGIRVGGQALTLTMRTPGDDVDLAAGFLVSEGIVRRAADIEQIRICAGDCGHPEHQLPAAPHAHEGHGTSRGHRAGVRDDQEGLRHPGVDHAGNVADVTLRPGLPGPAGPARSFLMTSACGVCGRSGLDDLITRCPYDLAEDHVQVTPDVLAGLPGRLREAQQVFSRTGGLHAAAVFAPDGTLLAAREDVGRHNAVDKVVGWALRDGRLPLSGTVLLVSGRASFELVQKAVMAGIPVLAAVSAPSSLAAGLAEDTGLTLVGFLRGGSMNVYTGEHRVAAAGG
jgi:FdhD protein